MMDSDDPEYGVESREGSDGESDVEIIEQSTEKSPSIPAETGIAEAGWIKEGPPANWEVAVSAISPQIALQPNR